MKTKRKTIIITTISIYFLLFVLAVLSADNEFFFTVVFFAVAAYTFFNIIFLLNATVKYLVGWYNNRRSVESIPKYEKKQEANPNKKKIKTSTVWIIIILLPVLLLFLPVFVQLIVPIMALYLISKAIKVSNITVKSAFIVIIYFALAIVVLASVLMVLYLPSILPAIMGGGNSLTLVAIGSFPLVVFSLGFLIFSFIVKKKIGNITTKKILTQYLTIFVALFLVIFIEKQIYYQYNILTINDCAKIDNTQEKEWCWREKAEATRKVEICEKLINNSSSRHRCYIDIARQEKDPAMCKKINQREYKDECYYAVSVELLFEKNRLLLCEKIKDTQIKQRCYRGGKSW